MTDSLITETDVVVDDNKNYLTELVGEDKKFKTPEELAKGKFHADQTIEIYKRRMDEMREENLQLRQETNTKARLEELINQYQDKLASSENTPAKEDKQPLAPKVDDEETFLKRISAYESKKKSDENFNIVKNKLTEQFGDTYSTVLKQRSTELGLPIEDIDSLARKSPTAFFRTLGLDQPQQEQFNTPPRSQQRADQFAPKVQKRTWSYYQDLKRKDPELYHNQKIAVQMQKDALELGEAFRDGDYYKPGLHDRN